MDDIKDIKAFNNVRRFRGSLKERNHFELYKEKDTQKPTIPPHESKMKSDNKLINSSELVPNLLNKVNRKNSSKNNNYSDNNSYAHDSNSSELNDDNESFLNSTNNINNKPIISKKIPKLLIEKTEEVNEYKNLEVPVTYREKRRIKKIENSPYLTHRKYSKENRDSLVLKLNKYFFQEGEIENIDTIIKYNINKIKIIHNNEEISSKNILDNSNNNLNIDFDYYNIKQEVISLMDIFAHAFDTQNKSQLISAIKELNKFAEKYKFDYVTQLTLDWLMQIKDKKYDKCELKYIGYYNQIRDIMDKMLKELKKKADYILISQKRKNKENKVENLSNNDINKIVPILPINNNILKKNSINKEDLLKTKEIVPIKIDIEVKNNLNIKEVEEILKNLDEGDFGNAGNKGNTINHKKLLNKLNNNRNEELEAFSYPFKEDNLCIVF